MNPLKDLWFSKCRPRACIIYKLFTSTKIIWEKHCALAYCRCTRKEYVLLKPTSINSMYIHKQYVNHELPDVQAGFRKGRGTRDQIANIHWIIEKARKFQKNISFCFVDYAKAFDCVDHSKLRKILQELGIPDHLTCLLRNLYSGQEATVRTGHGTTDWFQWFPGSNVKLCPWELRVKAVDRSQANMSTTELSTAPSLHFALPRLDKWCLYSTTVQARTWKSLMISPLLPLCIWHQVIRIPLPEHRRAPRAIPPLLSLSPWPQGPRWPLTPLLSFYSHVCTQQLVWLLTSGIWIPVLSCSTPFYSLFLLLE